MNALKIECDNFKKEIIKNREIFTLTSEEIIRKFLHTLKEIDINNLTNDEIKSELIKLFELKETSMDIDNLYKEIAKQYFNIYREIPYLLNFSRDEILHFKTLYSKIKEQFEKQKEINKSKENDKFYTFQIELITKLEKHINDLSVKNEEKLFNYILDLSSREENKEPYLLVDYILECYKQMRLIKTDDISIFDNKFIDKENKAYYIDLYYTSEKKFIKETLTYVQTKINDINTIINKNYLFVERTKYLQKLLCHYNLKNFYEFISLATLQVEGLINDLIEFLKKSTSDHSITAKMHLLYNDIIFDQDFLYWTFVFPNKRNDIAHGNIIDCEKEAIMSLLDLHSICQTLNNINLPHQQFLQLIDGFCLNLHCKNTLQNIKDPPFLEILKETKNELKDLEAYLHENFLIDCINYLDFLYDDTFISFYSLKEFRIYIHRELKKIIPQLSLMQFSPIQLMKQNNNKKNLLKDKIELLIKYKFITEDEAKKIKKNFYTQCNNF